ncbi:MAG: hypothetical protein M1816_005904 [Peltula sp. TS41687]|nr:MAG: hypothetical protein M1816_005904 [Peltula sp. TS41687]
MCETIDKEQDPAVRYIKAVEYLRGLTGLKLTVVEAKVRLYMLNSLLIIWSHCCSDGKKAQGYDVATLLWYNIMELTERRVLDEINAKRSLFVVAPTSAGKTFISFYAIEQVLEADDDGILVYVAPTKALINQIAAEVQARFSKTFKHARKSVWDIHTRDHRMNSLTGYQILVTVPHTLQIILLAPSNANSESQRVKRIIFDEIHSIGQVEDGIVWELLLLAPCPIIALSATVDNPEEFNIWIPSTQKAIDTSLTMVQNHQWYSDLRKFIYKHPKKFLFNSLAERPVLAPLALDGVTGLAFMHPIASLVNRSRGLPDGLSLEAQDCLTFWHSMDKHQSRGYCVDEALSPYKALPDVVRKVNIINWEAALKRVLKAWMSDNNAPFDAVLQDLSKTVHEQGRPEVQVESRKTQVSTRTQSVDAEDFCATTLPLFAQLHAQDALLAILFNYDQTMYEKPAGFCRAKLEGVKLEVESKGRRLGEEGQEKQAKKPKDKSSKKSGRGSDSDERTSKLGLQRETGDSDTDLFVTFDRDAPMEEFRFADWKKLLPSELQMYCLQLEKRRLPSWLGQGLARGIGHEDNQLPLTCMKYGGDLTSMSLTLPGTLPPTSIRSSFVALSGHSDDFKTISNLCRTTRSRVFLEEAVIPYVSLYPEKLDTPLNAYLYDFFKHGDITALKKANHVRRGDIWFLINDFCLVLATMIMSLMNFMKLAPESGTDPMDVMDSGDTFEEAKDDNVAELVTESQTQLKDNAGRKQHALAEKDAGKVADS